jgi:hypothetical protein
LLLSPVSAQEPNRPKLEITVVDEAILPVRGVHVELVLDRSTVQTADSDELGRVSFPDLRPGAYAITATKDSYEAVENRDVEIAASAVSLRILMAHAVSRTDSVEVRGTVVEVDSASQPNTLPPQAARELPSRPATVSDVLPLTPGVIREPGGGLILSSSPESRAALIVNSADVTDPATGQFGQTIPIDSVEVLNVYQTAYLAEFGRFTAGLVSVETRRGGEKWKWELNDPLPEFRIRSYRLRGLKTATPRVNFEGPLIPSKLFVSEGFEYEVRKTEVFTLPFPLNQKVTQGINSFSQIDWLKSNRHWLTATLHAAIQRLNALTLDYYNPLPTTPDEYARNLTGTVIDRLTFGPGTWENRFSTTYFDGSVWGKGAGPLTITPAGNAGDYFADQVRSASRISGNSAYAFSPVARWGIHHFKAGVYFASSEHSGNVTDRPIDIVDLAGHVLINIEFPRPFRTYDVSDIEKSFFGQDHWVLTPRLAIDLGVRTEAQQISGTIRIAPRTGFAWTPVSRARTVIRGGAGYFYDRVPLNVYAFNKYPDRQVTFYNAAGDITSGPTLFLNTLGESLVRHPFISQTPTDGNFSPRSIVWSAQVEQPVTNWLKLRATYLRNDSDGLVILDRVPPDPATNQGAYLLEGSGVSHYRQFDINAGFRIREDRQLFVSYTRSSAHGDLNDFGRFLGTAPDPVIHLNQYGTLSSDVPNRFLAWGVFRLPRQFQIAPVLEYRTGFPYIQVNAQQSYVGVPNSTRFPDFFSLDSRFSKDLKINAKYSVRVSVSGFNLTNHFNPEQVHNNIDGPDFGTFFGHRGRRFTADFDFLF